MDIHIVDDEEIMRSLYAGMMDALNYTAQLFTGPDHYLEYMASTDYLPPKLAILSDVQMPVMSGYEFMCAVRKRYPHQRFVIVTGSPEVPTQDEFACFYLLKPLRLAKLEKVLQAFSLCNEKGAHSDVIRCASIDDRCAFCVNAWKCPRSGDSLG